MISKINNNSSHLCRHWKHCFTSNLNNWLTCPDKWKTKFNLSNSFNGTMRKTKINFWNFVDKLGNLSNPKSEIRRRKTLERLMRKLWKCRTLSIIWEYVYLITRINKVKNKTPRKTTQMSIYSYAKVNTFRAQAPPKTPLVPLLQRILVLCLWLWIWVWMWVWVWMRP